MRHPLKSLAAVALGAALVGGTPALATAATTATGVSATTLAPSVIPVPTLTNPATIVPDLVHNLLTVTPAVYSVPGAATFQYFVNGLLTSPTTTGGVTGLPIPTNPSDVVTAIETFIPTGGTSLDSLNSLATLAPTLTQAGNTLTVQGATLLDAVGGLLGSLLGGSTTTFQFFDGLTPLCAATSLPVCNFSGTPLGPVTVQIVNTVHHLLDPVFTTIRTVGLTGPAGPTGPGGGTGPAGPGATAAPAYSASTPRITGKHKAGKRLHAKNVSVTAPGYTVTYTWLRNGRTIAKAGHGLSYKLVKKDRNKRIAFRITLTYPGYAPNTVTSASVKIKR